MGLELIELVPIFMVFTGNADCICAVWFNLLLFYIY